MVTPRGLKRKAAFKSALVMAGKTQSKWAEETGISLGHLSEVLHEKRQSPPLVAKIDAFIRETRTGRPARTDAEAA